MTDQKDTNERVYQLLQTWMKAKKVITKIDSKSIISLDLSSTKEYHFIVPQVTKDLYYSLFVHELLSYGKATEWSLYSVLEAVYTMVFTPSPSGWNTGKDIAMERGEETNFVTRFILGMVEENKCVSAGKGRRRQVSHQRSVHMSKIMMSLNNLLTMVELANESDDTHFVVSSFSEKPEKGGLFLAGMLAAQEMINVLTKIGIITNKIHSNNVLIATGTKTCERLKLLGVKTVNEQEKLVTYLSAKFGISSDTIENGLCKCMRDRNSKRKFYDTVSKTQMIYTMIHGKLRAYDLKGTEVKVYPTKWRILEIKDSFTGIRWWNSDYESEYKKQLCENMILTRN